MVPSSTGQGFANAGPFALRERMPTLMCLPEIGPVPQAAPDRAVRSLGGAEGDGYPRGARIAPPRTAALQINDGLGPLHRPSSVGLDGLEARWAR
jgi:hypothetical protein